VEEWVEDFLWVAVEGVEEVAVLSTCPVLLDQMALEAEEWDAEVLIQISKMRRLTLYQQINVV